MFIPWYKCISTNLGLEGIGCGLLNNVEAIQRLRVLTYDRSMLQYGEIKIFNSTNSSTFLRGSCNIGKNDTLKLNYKKYVHLREIKTKPFKKK